MCAVVSHFSIIAVHTARVLIQYYHDKQVYTSCNVAYSIIIFEWVVENGQHQLNVDYCTCIIPARVTCLNRVYPKCNSHSRLLTSLILHRAMRPTISSDLRHGRLMDHAHPRKLHNRYNVHDDEFRRILYHHKSIASTRQQQVSWKYEARIFRHQFQPCQAFAAARSISEGVCS